MNAWDVFRNEEFGEEQIRREVERLQRQEVTSHREPVKR
jgi:hypothetical protein